MKRWCITLLILLVSAGSVLADRPWAPGVSGAKTHTGSTNFPAVWLRFGPSFTSTNAKRVDEGKLGDASMLGLDLEGGIRPFTSQLSPKASLSLDVPLVVSVLQGIITQGDQTSIVLLGRLIPTVRLTVTLPSGIMVAPYVGLGAGTELSISGFPAADFQLVKVWRLGGDVMLSKTFGLGLTYTHNSFTSGHGHWDDFLPEDFNLNELTLSMYIRL